MYGREAAEANFRVLFGQAEKDEELLKDMLFRIRECNHQPQEARESTMEFVVDGSSVGKVTQKVANLLISADSSTPNGAVFEVVPDPSTSAGSKILTLAESAGTTVDSRTDAIMSVMRGLQSRNIVTGWRDELYPCAGGFYDEPLFYVERAAAPFLGMLQYGVHINGIVPSASSSPSSPSLNMWMARRSATKSKYPAMLDQMVAGGQPAGISLIDNVVKECLEEAGIPEELTLRGIRPAGAVSYEQFEPFDSYDAHARDDTDTEADVDGVFTRAVLFNYDLELPKDFVPRAVDGEVDEFFTWDLAKLLESISRDYPDPIKPNCYICIIDFLLREGYVSPDVPGYLDVLRELRSGNYA